MPGGGVAEIWADALQSLATPEHQPVILRQWPLSTGSLTLFFPRQCWEKKGGGSVTLPFPDNTGEDMVTLPFPDNTGEDMLTLPFPKKCHPVGWKENSDTQRQDPIKDPSLTS